MHNVERFGNFDVSVVGISKNGRFTLNSSFKVDTQEMANYDRKVFICNAHLESKANYWSIQYAIKIKTLNPNYT
jgi:hypothetical protein